MSRKHWILYDGECGMCRRAAAWIRRRDKQGKFKVVAYQDAPSPPMTPSLYTACEQAVHVVRADGTVLRAGRACLFIVGELGWGWFARLLARPPFVWAVELGYRIVATNRSFFARFLFTRGNDR